MSRTPMPQTYGMAGSLPDLAQENGKVFPCSKYGSCYWCADSMKASLLFLDNVTFWLLPYWDPSVHLLVQLHIMNMFSAPADGTLLLELMPQPITVFFPCNLSPSLQSGQSQSCAAHNTVEGEILYTKLVFAMNIQGSTK